MARLTEEMVIARAKQSDLSAVKKLNCWGSELVDVSLLRRMPNIEVLSLSVNKVNTLADVAHCPHLRELYVRRNRISDLCELRHIQGLQKLKHLWLDENPCASATNYRMTVLRALPHLETLDNYPVEPGEVQEAMKKGALIVDPEDSDGYYEQNNYQPDRSQYRSLDSSPERAGDVEQDYRRIEQVSDCSDQDANPYTAAQLDLQGSRGDVSQQTSLPPDKTPTDGPAATVASTATHTMRLSQSTNSVKDNSPPSARSAGAGAAIGSSHYGMSHPQCHHNNNNRFGSELNSPTYPAEYHERYQTPQQDPLKCPTDAWEREKDKRIDRDNGPNETSTGTNIASALLADYRGFTRRPVTRNSNLLSAVLCLVKELDYPSLEVTEMAVRCRMDELANSQ